MKTGRLTAAAAGQRPALHGGCLARCDDWSEWALRRCHPRQRGRAQHQVSGGVWAGDASAPAAAFRTLPSCRCPRCCGACSPGTRRREQPWCICPSIPAAVTVVHRQRTSQRSSGRCCHRLDGPPPPAGCSRAGLLPLADVRWYGAADGITPGRRPGRCHFLAARLAPGDQHRCGGSACWMRAVCCPADTALGARDTRRRRGCSSRPVREVVAQVPAGTRKTSRSLRG
jgi:hypothetical protein